MNNKEIYGHFYIFHDHKQEDLNNLLLSNRCYLGFSKKGKTHLLFMEIVL